MTYKLKFIPSAWKEWYKLDASLRVQFKRKLAKRLENPHIPSDKLRGFENVYKIKLRTSGYRLIYQVEERSITVFVIAIGKRDRDRVYKTAQKRLE